MFEYLLSSSSLLPFVPVWLKAVVLVVFLLNWRSFPFVWSYGVLSEAALDTILPRIRGPLAHLRTKRQIGADPWQVSSKITRWAGFDSIDYYGHLSNSSYAKSLDALRMKVCMELFCAHFVAGGWIGVGETHYNFMKEIPPFTTYEIEMKIGGFNDKWMFFIGTFTSAPTSKSSRKPRASPTDTPASAFSMPDVNLGSGANTPTNGSSTPNSVAAAVASALLPRADGRVVHCISVTSYVWKVGRRTVPPAVILSFNGYGHSKNWARTEKLIAGGKKAQAKWLTEGWKEEVGVVEEFEAEGKKRAAKLSEWKAVMESL